MKRSLDSEPRPQGNLPDEKPNSWWYRIYLLVVIVTAVVIALLGTFTWYFSR